MQEGSTSAASTLDIWGYLEPIVPSANVTRLNLSCSDPIQTFGRGQGVTWLLRSMAVSERHATIVWNEKRDKTSICYMIDNGSHNGTYVDGARLHSPKLHISGSRFRIMDGAVICFAAKVPVEGEVNDYRYIFHDCFGRHPHESAVFNHYRVTGLLGSGGFGEVYKAYAKDTGAVVAVKTIKKGATDEPIETAGREIMAMMRLLEHPNVCTLHEVFFRIDGSYVDIVLEFINGGTLYDHVCRHGLLKEPQTKEFTFQLCGALAFLHLSGISHGDLKLENILLVNHHICPLVKLADFGMAFMRGGLKNSPVYPAETEAGYMPPEVYHRPAEEVKRRRVDSWSVGVIVLMMFTGENPFVIAQPADPHTRVNLWPELHPDAYRFHNPPHQFIEFVQGLLHIDIMKRLSLVKAQKHFWFARYRSLHPDLRKFKTRVVNVTENVPVQGEDGYVSSGTEEPSEPGSDYDSDDNMECMSDVDEREDVDMDMDMDGRHMWSPSSTPSSSSSRMEDDDSDSDGPRTPTIQMNFFHDDHVGKRRQPASYEREGPPTPRIRSRTLHDRLSPEADALPQKRRRTRDRDVPLEQRRRNPDRKARHSGP
ncbi:kinase-like domain-containing protein [Mycena rebaudengoi]|nr:kinase-like domain-containing protein [Mycena rebaudengoi]